MPYVLDESSYRIEKNTFPSEEEAKDRAEEAARILGRAITVYELLNQELHFAFRVMPDGSVDKTNPLPEHEPVEPAAPVAIGSAEPEAAGSVQWIDLFDAIAETLEQSGRPDLAAEIDREAVATDGPDESIKKMVYELKKSEYLGLL